MGGRRFVGWMLFSLVMVFTSVASFATTYGIVIGVATYADPRIEDLTYAATDAISFAQSLQEQSDVSPSRITLLTNDEATRAAIEQAFTNIAEITRPEDKVIIYFSGHGASVPDLNGDEADGDGNDEAFLPCDAAKGDPSSYIIDDDLGEWIARIPAEKVAVFIDSCYSGGQARALDEGTLGKKGPSDSIAKDVLTDATPQQRREILAACQPSQLAWENRGLQHGVFTYFVLQGMADNSADTNGDGKVSFRELGAYVTDKLASWSQGREEKQNPVAEGSDEASVVIVPDINDRCRTRLVAHYTFDGNTDDPVGGRDGINHGAQLVPGIIGQAYEFDDDPDHNTYIVADSSFEPGTGPFAVSVWFKTDEVNPAGWIFSTHNTDNWYAPTYALLLGRDGTLTFRTNDAPALHRQDLHSENFGWNDGQWHHVVIERDTDGRKDLWVDGSLEASEYYSSQNIICGNHPFTIGGTAYYNWNYDRSFQGTIDDLRIYEGVLSEDDIRGLFAQGVPEKPVSFPDVDLEGAIRKALHRPTGPILNIDLLGIRQLDLSGLGIKDLTGIEYCRDMKVLTINNAQIADFTPLSAMRGLHWLYLENDNISDISFLANTRTLRILDLAGNHVSDLSPIEGCPLLWKVFLTNNNVYSLVPLPYGREFFLAGNAITSLAPLADSTHLRVLDINGNNVSDISVLSKSPWLKYLNLSNNKISDLKPLVDNPGVEKNDILDVRGNPLDLSSDSMVTEQIEELRSRGVQVTTD